MAIRCPNCGNENPDDYVYCDECGARLHPASADAGGEAAAGSSDDVAPTSVMPAVSATASDDATAAPAADMAPADEAVHTTTSSVRCPNCGAENLPGAAFCDECGAALSDVQPDASAATDVEETTSVPVAAAETSDEDSSQSSQPSGTVETPAAEVPVPATEDTIVAAPEDTDTATEEPAVAPAEPANPSYYDTAGASSTVPDYTVSDTETTVAAPEYSDGVTDSDMDAVEPVATSDQTDSSAAQPSIPEPSYDAVPMEPAVHTEMPAVAVPTANATPSTPAAPEMTTCRNCGAPMRADALFCTRCGTPAQQPEQKMVCPNCGNELHEGDVFCARCGTRVTDITSGAASGASSTPVASTPSVSTSSTVIEPMRHESVVTTAPAMPVEAVAPVTVAPTAPPMASTPATPTPTVAPVIGAPTAPPPTTAPFGGSTASTGRARLELVSGGQSINLPDKNEILVGREDPLSDPPIFPDVDLTPFGGEDGGVSRRHARIVRQGNDYMVEDLQSTNYTKLNGQRLPPRTPMLLVDGSRVDFGKIAVVFRR